MRLRIDMDGIEFRVAGMPRPKMQSRKNQVQRMTPDGRPIWVVRLSAFDTGPSSTETIWVEVAGDEPQLTPNETAKVEGLVFSPWVSEKGEIMRSFRAVSITQDSGQKRAAA